MVDTLPVAGHADADFVNEQGRADLVDPLPPVLPELVHGVETTDIGGPRVDFGRNGQPGPQ
jgi:hypothetical protein